MLYDCFTFFNELDLLEIRFHEMSAIVDKFVVVEAAKTFSGQPKPLYFWENRERFAGFLDKVIHVPVTIPDALMNEFSGKSDAWAREYYQRDQILKGLQFAQPDDLVMVSDVDEIVSAAKLEKAISDRAAGELVIFTLSHNIYYLNRRAVHDPVWSLGPRMLEFKHLTSPQKLRMTRIKGSKRIKKGALQNAHTRLMNFFKTGISNPIRIIPDAGWHFSSIGDWKKFRMKIEAYSHQEMLDADSYRNERAFYDDVMSSTETVDIAELPKFIQLNLERFGPNIFSVDRQER